MLSFPVGDYPIGRQRCARSRAELSGNSTVEGRGHLVVPELAEAGHLDEGRCNSLGGKSCPHSASEFWVRKGNYINGLILILTPHSATAEHSLAWYPVFNPQPGLDYYNMLTEPLYTEELVIMSIASDCSNFQQSV